jgi:N-acetyl-anhydromuramyl-L-alanine amidase AmpD
VVEAKVPRGAAARLIIKGKEAAQTIQLALGKLELPTSVKGAQQRLRSLGYKLDVSGALDAATKKALKAFQNDHALPGAADIASLAKHIHAAYQGK